MACLKGSMVKKDAIRMYNVLPAGLICGLSKLPTHHLIPQMHHLRCSVNRLSAHDHGLAVRTGTDPLDLEDVS